ncbi:hypothetical protein H6G17_26385 [Chroococcidiopsis sp. FACHB-1243]|nr:hypothetical protein [Chroococcidiopsis sp. [FACHB-1243]]MBD2308995.1 hypothetical protein [Chroococcidiopsis sp. [FACHB-1243]]
MTAIATGIQYYVPVFVLRSQKNYWSVPALNILNTEINYLKAIAQI